MRDVWGLIWRLLILVGTSGVLILGITFAVQGAQR